MSAMYYLSRGGPPEGPFEEARLLYMIQTGELTQGGVCPVGQNQWLSLAAFPVFAQALAARAPVPQYAPPAAPGHSAAVGPTAPGDYVAPPPAHQGGVGPTAPGDYVAPAPGNYGVAAPGTPPAAPQNAPRANPQKKGGKGLLIALLAGTLVLFLCGAALGAYFWFFSSGGAHLISQSVPQDCELLVEIPSVRKLVLDLHDVRFLDTSLRDDKKVFDGASDSVAQAFDISQSDASSLLTAAETFGISARKLSTSPEGAVAMGMRSAAPVEALLKSSRFVASGVLGVAGRRYQLTRKQLAPSAGQDILLKTLAEAELGATAKEVLVWFPAQKFLAIGSEPLLTDIAKVIESGAPSLQQNLLFQAAKKDFTDGSRLNAFLDPGGLSGLSEPKAKAIVDGYFTPAGPMTASLRVKSAGFVGSFIGRATGSKLPSASVIEPPQALTLADQLPVETFAYVAFSTQNKLSAADAEKMLLDQVGSLDARTKNEAEQGLRQTEQLLGVTAGKLVEGIGGQSVLGIAASTDTAIDQLRSGPAAAARFNVTWVLELKDDAEYKKLAAQLKQKLLPGVREAVLSEDGAGFRLAPRGTPLPISLRVKFLDKHLFVTAGSNALCDRAEAAFSKGDRALKGDAAHLASLAALPDVAHVRLWVDTGRILDTLLKNPALKAHLAEQGLTLDKITLTGPDRVVSALALRADVQNEVWTYRVDALNFQELAPLGAGVALLGSGLPGLPAL